MGVMPGNVSKRFTKKINDFPTDKPNRDRVLGRLLSPDSISDIAVGELGLSGKDEEHVRKHWFGKNDPERWWKHLPDPEPTIRQAFIDALQKAANTPNFPIEVKWICVGTAITAQVNQTALQITINLCTPPIPPGQDN